MLLKVGTMLSKEKQLLNFAYKSEWYETHCGFKSSARSHKVKLRDSSQSILFAFPL